MCKKKISLCENIKSLINPNSKFGVVAVLSLKGIISNGSMGKSTINIESLNPKIEQAFSVKNLKAVALNINCPGGSPAQTELIFERIRQLSREKQIPVYSFIEDVAASGGYWLALSGEKIYSLKSSIIGSIGVISTGFGFKEVIKKIGIERRIHTIGTHKSFLDPFEDENSQDVEILNNLQRDIYEHFIETVKSTRGSKISPASDIFDGMIWSGSKALELGLVDEIGNMHDVVRQIYGQNVKLKEIEAKKSWLNKKLGINFINTFEDIIDNIFLKIEHKLKFNKLDQF